MRKKKNTHKNNQSMKSCCYFRSMASLGYDWIRKSERIQRIIVMALSSANSADKLLLSEELVDLRAQLCIELERIPVVFHMCEYYQTLKRQIESVNNMLIKVSS